jgi:hypothetical protein
MLVPTNLFQSRNRQPFTRTDRKQPIYFRFPYHHIEDTQITFPSTLHMESLAEEAAPIKTSYSLYQVKHSLAGNTVTFSRDFAMAEFAFDQKDYTDLRKFYQDVNSRDSEQLVLTAGQ